MPAKTGIQIYHKEEDNNMYRPEKRNCGSCDGTGGNTEHVLTACHDCKGSGKCYPYVNEESKFWAHSYLVSFASCLGWESAICVNADNEQDAIDAAADYAEEQGWVGYFLDEADPWVQELAGFGEVSFVGNHGLLIQDTELHVRRLD